MVALGLEVVALTKKCIRIKFKGGRVGKIGGRVEFIVLNTSQKWSHWV